MALKVLREHASGPERKRLLEKLVADRTITLGARYQAQNIYDNKSLGSSPAPPAHPHPHTRPSGLSASPLATRRGREKQEAAAWQCWQWQEMECKIT